MVHSFVEAFVGAVTLGRLARWLPGGGIPLASGWRCVDRLVVPAMFLGNDRAVACQIVGVPSRINPCWPAGGAGRQGCRRGPLRD